MHLKRWITGLVAAPLLILLIYAGGAVFAGFIGVVALVSIFEYFRIVFKPGGKITSIIFLALLFIAGAAAIFAAHCGRPDMIVGVAAVNLILCGIVSLARFKSDPEILSSVEKHVQGVVYIPLLLSFLVLIRNSADGMTWIFLLVLLIFAGDTGAFYAGRSFGKHKLCPSVSPGKTVEGAVGGILANIVAGSIIKGFFLPEIPWLLSILFFIIAGATGQIGDLFESQLKRVSDIKDSGAILPGHGGILDRIDALMFAAPVTYLFKVYVSGLIPVLSG